MKKLTSLAFLLAIPGIGSIATVHADDWCKHSANRSATIDAAGATKIVIGAGAGELSVRGENVSSVRASGRACASSEDLLGQIQLESRREGTIVYLKTAIPQVQSSVLGFGRYASLDLEVVVPESVAIDLEDSSGDLELRNVKSAVVADSSGDIDISNVSGNLDVTDSSGDMEIEKVGGNLSVRDSSGDMELEDIQGSVLIPVDSSGDIHIQRAASVHVVNDSSGEMVISQVKGDVRIDSDSSGEIDVTEVDGSFSVGSDGSGGIHHSRVKGTVTIPEE